LYWSLGICFVVGLAVHVCGFLLKSWETTEPLSVLADLLYTLGWALWTGVVVVVFIQLYPETKGVSTGRPSRPMRRRAAIRPEPGVAGSCSASRASRTRLCSGTARPPAPDVVMDDGVSPAPHDRGQVSGRHAIGPV
jgi:hypothetical protein